MTSENHRNVETREGGSGLFYHGTGEEVRLGDRVRIKRLFGRDLLGSVCYIPGKSPVHKDLEYDDVRQWAIRLDDGTVLAMAYSPQHRLGQPKRDLVLVERSLSPQVLSPSEELE